MREQDTSKFCFAQATDVDPSHGLGQFLRNHLPGETTCFFRDFYVHHNSKVMKHHQWIVLGREHAKTVVSKAAVALSQWAKTWEERHHDGCSDESVPIAAILLDAKCPLQKSALYDMGIRRSCLTYVNWRGCFYGLKHDLSNATRDLTHLWETWNSSTVNAFWDSRSKKTINGLPWSFAHVDEAHLDSIVNQGFMFARKFEKDATVSRYDNSVRPLEEVLPQKWATISPRARLSVWTSLDVYGEPKTKAL
eukprot:TRINITY_DN9296_c0_g2_i1.p1 TRINITY_DN9296_c0_g2~~TRINITY_DN9296_c0_g2_i1.p1  ORF type:complete len:250 (-),score=18.68 TRINITY_DN9296_c0_g2_i1:30-779(-)